MKTVKAWHFIRADYRLGYSDCRKVAAGKTIKVDGPPKLCKNGLHGSRRVLDALRYAPGPVVCRVTIGGEIAEDNDKLVGTERYIEWTLDATWILHEFACWCAERALKQANITDDRCWDAVKTKRLWLAGEAIDQELSAAWSASWSAARSASSSAARSASSSASWSADNSAAWFAAWSAAWSAAISASISASWSAAISAQNRKLAAMLNDAE